MNKRIIIGLSGGIDSSVAALLLIHQGWEVIGVTANLDKDCPNANYTTKTNSDNAKTICEFLSIPHYDIDYREIFELVIVDNFYHDYINGQTPNPCVWCNKRIKWSAYASLGLQLDCQNYATGHYARRKMVDGNLALLKGVDPNKDQSYFLCHVPYDMLKRTEFPLGELTKPEVFNIANQHKLPIIPSNESNDICFLRFYNNRTAFFNKKYKYEPKPITVVDSQNKFYSCKRPIEDLTYGQRAPVPLPGQPINYVWKIDAANGKVFVAPKGIHLIYSIELEQFNLTTVSNLDLTKQYIIKTRYRQDGQFARVHFRGKNLIVEFSQPAEFIAPGQWGVVYDGDVLIGGGRITDSHVID